MESQKIGAGHVAANTVRLLIAGTQAGGLIGASGQNIENLRNSSGATITVLGQNQMPLCASLHESDRVVQVSRFLPWFCEEATVIFYVCLLLCVKDYGIGQNLHWLCVLSRQNIFLLRFVLKFFLVIDLQKVKLSDAFKANNIMQFCFVYSCLNYNFLIFVGKCITPAI